MSHAPTTARNLLVWVNGVVQIPDSGFSVSGLTLTFSSPPASGSVLAAVLLGHTYDIGKPTDGSVSLASMASESVDEDNLHISNAGSNGEFLQKQSGNAGGLTWATAGGKVLQAVGMGYATSTDNNTNNFAATGVTIDITPAATSSKVLVLVTINGIVKQSGNSSSGAIFKVERQIGGGYQDLPQGSVVQYVGYDGVNQGPAYQATFAMSHLDSPSTTSAATYRVLFKNNTNATGVTVQSDSAASSIVCLEIGA